MAVVTGLSGNEIYCLRLKGFQPGDLLVGNSIYSIGMLGGIGSGLRTMLGGEVTQLTSIIHDGRANAYQRMVHEAQQRGGIGITGVSSELVTYGGNVEFLSIGSAVHQGDSTGEPLRFSSSADGQELYCQIDAGFTPVRFVFGNVAYSIGVGGGILGALRSIGRGEVVEYSEIFNRTRHLALERIKTEAREANANAVVGIQTSIMALQGMQEMVMLGTASRHPLLMQEQQQDPITSDLTNEEMWNLINLGYMPVRLLLGVSVYSLGLIGSITAAFKALVRGEISELTSLIYEAREKAIGQIAHEAMTCGADDVVGVKTYVYELGSGIIEFLAMGTAVKKMSGLTTVSPALPPQAIIQDKDTFINTAEIALGKSLSNRTGTDS